MMLRKVVFTFLFIAIAVAIESCGIGKQLKQLSNLSRCQFKLNSVNNTTLANVDVQRVRSISDLNIAQAAAITSALANNKLPLNFLLNVDVKNPNTSTAALNGFEWLLFIDDVEMVGGNVSNRLEVSPNGVATLPLQINIDLVKALSGRSRDAVLNFGLNLAKNGNQPSRMMLRLKPTVMIGNIPVAYPGYINVKTEFTSGS